MTCPQLLSIGSQLCLACLELGLTCLPKPLILSHHPNALENSVFTTGRLSEVQWYPGNQRSWVELLTPKLRPLGGLLSAFAFWPSLRGPPCPLWPLQPCVTSFCHMDRHLSLCWRQLFSSMHLVPLNFINQILCLRLLPWLEICDFHGLLWSWW